MRKIFPYKSNSIIKDMYKYHFKLSNEFLNLIKTQSRVIVELLNVMDYAFSSSSAIYQIHRQLGVF